MTTTTSANLKWDVEADNGVITINFRDCMAHDLQSIVMVSDVHFDNAHCNRDLYKKHMEWALQNNAPVIDIGDWFCAMQGKWDKRKSEEAMRPEYRGGRYLDKLVDYGADWMQDYAPVLAVMGYGNHETAILSHHETDLTERLVQRLRDRGADNLHKGRFAGWIRLRFWSGGNSTAYHTINYYYHHGWGGGGPVTRGAIDTARMSVYLPDAQIVHTGHVHHEYEMPICRHRLTSHGREVKDTQIHIRTPGYKDEISCGNGWAVERGMAPRPQGCRVMTFQHNGSMSAPSMTSFRMAG